MFVSKLGECIVSQVCEVRYAKSEESLMSPMATPPKSWSLFFLSLPAGAATLDAGAAALDAGAAVLPASEERRVE